MYPNNNPCACVGTYSPPISPCSKTCTCLDLGNITVYPNDSVGPCGKTGVVSFTDCFDFCACVNEVATLSVEKVFPTGILTINSINQSGLSFTTSNDAKGNDKVIVYGRAKCTSPSGQELGDFFTVTIYVKDLCKDVLPGEGEICNKCNGEIEDDVNLTVY